MAVPGVVHAPPVLLARNQGVTKPVDSNRQPAILLYRLTDEGRVPHTLQLFDIDRFDAIGHVLVYHEPRLFSLFEASALR